jgi:hypothetical protein
MNYGHERGTPWHVFSDSYAATVLPIIREIHREILAQKPADAAISNRRSIGRLRAHSRHAESRQCTAEVGRRRRLRPCSIGARRHDDPAPGQPRDHHRPGRQRL